MKILQKRACRGFLTPLAGSGSPSHSPGQEEGSCHADPSSHSHHVGDKEVPFQENHEDEEGDGRLQRGQRPAWHQQGLAQIPWLFSPPTLQLQGQPGKQRCSVPP